MSKASIVDRPNDGRVVRHVGQASSSTGCTLEYSVFQQSDQRSERKNTISVVLAHGFLRDQSRLFGLATALARRGLPTLTLDLCNMRPWDGAHWQNARDMSALARQLGAGPVVYAGFSAGGLAALMAASEDSGAIGVFTLDLVDLNGVGQALAAALPVPLVGFMGAPSACNAKANGMAVLQAAAKGRVRVFERASHCDFEWPTDIRCELLCGSLFSGGEVQARRRAIRDAALDAIAAMVEERRPIDLRSPSP